MRTFNLVVNNGVATIPNTVAQENVMETLQHKKGFMHIVAYTDAKPLKRAREEGKIIGLVQGSWDQFHIGHQRYIKKAK